MSLCSQICTSGGKQTAQPPGLCVLNRLVIGAVTIPRVNFACLPCKGQRIVWYRQLWGTVQNIYQKRTRLSCFAAVNSLNSSSLYPIPQNKLLISNNGVEIKSGRLFLLVCCMGQKKKKGFKPHPGFLLVPNRESRAWMAKAGTLALLNWLCWVISLGGTLTIMAIAPLSSEDVDAIVWEAGRFQGLMKWPWGAAPSFSDKIEFSLCRPSGFWEFLICQLIMQIVHGRQWKILFQSKTWEQTNKKPRQLSQVLKKLPNIRVNTANYPAELFERLLQCSSLWSCPSPWAGVGATEKYLGCDVNK